MAFLDELKDRAMDLGRAGVAKSKQLAEITKLSLNNASEEDAIKKAYVEIGKLYYAERRITAAKVNIEENKNRIAELKAEGNVSDADIPHVETDVPPEEPVDGGCGCCDHEVAPEEVFSDDDKPQE